MPNVKVIPATRQLNTGAITNRPKKRKTWVPIKHTGDITNKAADKAVKRKQHK